MERVRRRVGWRQQSGHRPRPGGEHCASSGAQEGGWAVEAAVVLRAEVPGTDQGQLGGAAGLVLPAPGTGLVAAAAAAARSAFDNYVSRI